MMNKIIILGLCIVFIKCCKLPESYSDINIINNSNQSIDLYICLGGNYGTYYPDTLLPYTSNYIIKDIKSKITYQYLLHGAWKDIFISLPQDTLSVFILSTDTIMQYEWQEIRDNYNILKRYDLSLSDLEQLHFYVPYPPDETMENMKMFPR